MKQKNLLIAIFSAALAVLTFIGGYAIGGSNKQAVNVSQEKLSAEIIIKDGTNEQKYTVNYSEGDTAFDLLINLKKTNSDFLFEYKDYGKDLGAAPIRFNGTTAGSNQYWQFFVNDNSSNVGISSYKLVKGDKISFVLTSF